MSVAHMQMILSDYVMAACGERLTTCICHSAAERKLVMFWAKTVLEILTGVVGCHRAQCSSISFTTVVFLFVV